VAGATLLAGETYSANGSFTDPGADSWTGTVNYGDGSGSSALSLSNKSFSLSHTYATAGAFTISVNISDDDVVTTATSTVTVLTPGEAVEMAISVLDGLILTGAIRSSYAISIRNALEDAAKLLERGLTGPALEVLPGARTQLQNRVLNGRINASVAAPLELFLSRIIASLD
jgi:hypothetical protein